MNIFIDTSILYQDPFLKGSYSKELLEVIERKEINVFVSDIVLQELIYNYKKRIELINSQLRNTFKNIDRLEVNIDTKLQLDKSDSSKRLKKFYDNLLDNNNSFQKLNYSNEFLPEIVRRSINRLKPFSENKTELKDALIWLTYSKYVEQYNIDTCIFLSNNTRDFCTKTKGGKFEIHDELKKDSDRFKIYTSIKEFLLSEKDNLNLVDDKFIHWFDEQDFDENSIKEILLQNFEERITDDIESHISILKLNDVFEENEKSLDSYFICNDIILHEVRNLTIDILNDYAVITGKLQFFSDIEGYEYVSKLNSGDKKQELYGEATIGGDIGFSFEYDKNETPFFLTLSRVSVD